ncbi:acyl-CoA N-acyltransferase [Ceratobasidium sp. AG-I]|nr:acyl-CoA N-acyltransferase [Ceratobasidium sp. AG-I]
MAKQTEISHVTFRDATEEDLPFMNEIYNYNIIHTTGLFFTSPVSDEYRLKWFRNLKDPNTDGGPYPCLLGVRKGEAGQEFKLGYICYLPWLEGAQFHHVAEISLYISQKYTRSGLGAPFLNAILNHPLVERFRVIIAGITTENVPSIKFFSKHGFHFSGVFRNVGFKFGRWLNVAHYTLYFLGVAIPTPSGREIRCAHCRSSAKGEDS